MTANFLFLQSKHAFASFAGACLEAERSIAVSPATTAILSRRALELAVKWLYASDAELKVPYQDNLSSLIHERSFLDVIEPALFPQIKYVVKLGNVAAHTGSGIKREEAVLALHNLHQFVSWLDYCYADAYQETKFQEALLPTGDEQKVSRDELKMLANALGEKDQKLSDAVAENAALREELSKLRAKNTQEQDFNVDEMSEFATRKRYIDLDLRDAGWSFGQNCIEEHPVSGMPYGSGQGRVDYVLFGDNGRPLAVVEAKRTSKDAKVGQQQAKLYADCLEKEFQQRPVIFYTNGFDTYIWDDGQYPPRPVAGVYGKADLEWLVNRRTNKSPLQTIQIKETITNRYYQKEAIKAVCESFERGDRKALLVMATGSGKTRTVISLVDVLAKHGWVKNVLFLADRTALVSQAYKNFKQLLPNMSIYNLTDGKDSPESRVVFSTYPTMMNTIDDTKTKEGQKLFTVGHFDLIVTDEAHRSLYKKYQAIFNYFDALLVGLTATPKADLDKNTYGIFDLETNVPTYAYELEQAVTDGYLVPYRTVESQFKFLGNGIHYDELSEEEKEQYEETFADDETVGDEISGDALNQWLFNADTMDKVLQLVMEKGLKVEGNDKLGKTIIFARNHNHAEAVVERFNKLYPHLKGDFCRVIDVKVNYVQDLIDKFSDKHKLPQIAVSVDMLDTGIDIPELVNLVFFKKVRSKAKFWQMIGRGTRLCEDLFGVGADKECFYIFDCCGNFEFFRITPNGVEAGLVEGLTEQLFKLKVDLIKELQHLDYQTEDYIAFRKQLLDEVMAAVSALNREHFAAKQALKQVEKYSQATAWQQLGSVDVQVIKEKLAPLVQSDEDDELAKRFDCVMLTIQLALLLNKKASRAQKSVIKTGEALAKLGTIPQVLAKKAYIEQVLTPDYWDSATVLDHEAVRQALRELIKFIEKQHTKVYYTNFTDEVLSLKENEPEYGASALENYRKKVNQYVRAHQDHIAIHKLKNNQPLTRQEFGVLEQLLWGELGTREDYKKEFGETPLTLLVRQIIGLDQMAANEAFSAFLTDQNLDSLQIRFVKTIVDYIVKNGHMMDKSVLQEEPFKSLGSIAEVFQLEDAMKVVQVIDGINKNAVEVVGA